MWISVAAITRNSPTVSRFSSTTLGSMPLSASRRDTVAEAIVKECDEGRGLTTPDGRPAVLLDTTRIEAEVADQVLPYMMRRYRHAGIDPLTEPILDGWTPDGWLVELEVLGPRQAIEPGSSITLHIAWSLGSNG